MFVVIIFRYLTVTVFNIYGDMTRYTNTTQLAQRRMRLHVPSPNARMSDHMVRKGGTRNASMQKVAGWLDYGTFKELTSEWSKI